MVNEKFFLLDKNERSQDFFQFSFVLLLIAGVLSVDKYNLLAATALLELVFIVAALLCFSPKFERFNLYFASAASLYVVVCFLYAVLLNDVHALDFLQAFKAFIYIALISVFVGKRIFDLERFVIFYKVALLFFFVKYSYSIIFQFSERLAERPGVLDENNFELMFLILPLFAFAKFKIRGFGYYFAFVFFLVVISGSRSALLAVMVCFLFTFFRKVNVKFFACLAILPILVYLSISVFEARMVAGEGIENIDRVKLFYYFLQETQGWGFLDYLIGAARLTPLSDATCLALPFYDVLYSFSGDNSCYSVILHSYLMRVIFDHGAIGLFFILWFYYRCLIRANYERMLAVGFILSIAASALSVSSFNSVYVALSLAIAISLYTKHPSGKHVQAATCS